MWPTSQGDRTLKGKEASLVRDAIGYLRDMITVAIDLDESHETDVALLNKLQPTQQLTILHEVAFALLDESTPIPELTAIGEATVFAIYREMLVLIEMEIDANRNRTSPDYHIRSLALAVYEESCCEPENEWGEPEYFEDQFSNNFPQAANSIDMKKWENLIEHLADKVLWDRDFELESIYADHSPDISAMLKKMTGIADNFYSSAAPEIYSSEYHRIDGELSNLIASSDSRSN